MPFIGQDWRAPGETWVKTTEGWEKMKLRPLRNSSDASLEARCRIHTDSGSSMDISLYEGGPLSPPLEELDTEETTYDDYLPHCFIKTNKSKEFVGCTSMSEGFLKLNLSGAIADVRRFNYVCKLVQILVREKLQALSGSARKILLGLIESMVLHCMGNDRELNTVRSLVSDFMQNLGGSGQLLCGSPKLLCSHQETASNLYQLLTNVDVETPADCCEESLTFIDLPQECLRAILRRLSEHQSLLTTAKAHEALRRLVENETSLWQNLCRFHFTESQIDQVLQNMHKQEQYRRDRRKWRAEMLAKEKENLPPSPDTSEPEMLTSSQKDGPAANHVLIEKFQEAEDKLAEQRLHDWRHIYFELKKFFGLKEVYADMIHLCCHCKALFWGGLGHPCVPGQTAPSVRVTPQQFIDMLCM